ncbi:MAG: hypothetical protein JWN34_1908 [Bryobacterales bacterium]|nr:hypothetical protein [Bryobacterales bacterium]
MVERAQRLAEVDDHVLARLDGVALGNGVGDPLMRNNDLIPLGLNDAVAQSGSDRGFQGTSQRAADELGQGVASGRSDDLVEARVRYREYVLSRNVAAHDRGLFMQCHYMTGKAVFGGEFGCADFDRGTQMQGLFGSSLFEEVCGYAFVHAPHAGSPSVTDFEDTGHPQTSIGFAHNT